MVKTVGGICAQMRGASYSPRPFALPLSGALASSKITRSDKRPGGLTRGKFPGSSQEYVVLNSGKQMPLLGLGTSSASDSEVEAAIKTALKLGYRHIDTASMYKNEVGVGRGLKEARREDVFVTTKLNNSDHDPQRVAEAIREQLKDMQLDYVDLYLLHWPLSPPFQGTWRAMEELVDEGLVKSIGLSNFSVKKLKDVQSWARIQPAVNQVEVHVYHRNAALVKYCESTGVLVTAYAPIGSPKPKNKSQPPKDDPVVNEIASKYGKTPAQILLRWGIQHGVSVVPKSVKPERIAENLEIWDWELAEDDFKKLSSLPTQIRMFNGENFLKLSPYKTVEELWDEED